jgi:hypothetical protein
VAYYWGFSDQWCHVINTGGFALSYAVLAVVAVVAAVHLNASARRVLAGAGPPVPGVSGGAAEPAWEDPAPYPPPAPGSIPVPPG